MQRDGRGIVCYVDLFGEWVMALDGLCYTYESAFALVYGVVQGGPIFHAAVAGPRSLLWFCACDWWGGTRGSRWFAGVYTWHAWPCWSSLSI